MPPLPDPAVTAAFDSYPPAARRQLFVLRALILETAAATAGVGPLQECLRWGEPAYVTAQSGSGSTLRIAWKKAAPEQVALYVNCQTGLLETFRTLFPYEFRFEGQRALLFGLRDKLPRDALRVCIAAALTYHRHKR